MEYFFSFIIILTMCIYLKIHILFWYKFYILNTYIIFNWIKLGTYAIKFKS